MRIAYVVLHLGEGILRGGVGRKIRSHLGLWQDAGHEARLFLHTPDPVDMPEMERFQYLPGPDLPVLKGLGREISRSRALADLIARVRDYHPDLVYLRYGLYAYPLHRLFQPAPVVLELNSRDIDEYHHRGTFYYWANRLLRRVELGGATAWTPVTAEIPAFPENRGYAKPFRVIANGIDLDQLEPLPPTENTRPRLVMASSPGYGWHGVDKLPSLARRYPDLWIDVVGFRAQDLKESIPPNLVFHGFLPQKDMAAIVSRADAALGTLALHRKHMEEASPLKVREAVGYGLPVVLAYQDTDLSGKGLDFILQIPNQEDNLETHGQQIYNFACRMVGKRVARRVVYPLIDQRVKERSRLEFFEQILSTKNR